MQLLSLSLFLSPMASSAAAAYEDDHIPTRERRKKTPQTLVPVHRCVQVKTLLYRHTARRGCIRQPLHHCQLSIQELVREMSAPSSRSISLYIAPSLSVFFSLSFSSSQADKHDRLQRSRLARLLRNSGPARSFTLSTLHLPFF